MLSSRQKKPSCPRHSVTKSTPEKREKEAVIVQRVQIEKSLGVIGLPLSSSPHLQRGRGNTLDGRVSWTCTIIGCVRVHESIPAIKSTLSCFQPPPCPLRLRLQVNYTEGCIPQTAFICGLLTHQRTGLWSAWRVRCMFGDRISFSRRQRVCVLPT